MNKLHAFAFVLVVLAGFIGLTATPASASSMDIVLSCGGTGGTFTCSESGGRDRSATVLFEESAGNLLVTLTNTSGYDAMDAADLLSAVLFESPGFGPFTLVSATLCLDAFCKFVELKIPPGGLGDTLLGPGGDVTSWWAYEFGISAETPGGQEEGVSSVGFGIFGGVNGPPGGITSLADDLSTYGGRQPTEVAVNAVTFTLEPISAPPAYLPVGDITLVGAAFGSSFILPVPEPASLLLLGSGLVGVGLWGLRRRKLGTPLTPRS